MEDAGEMTPIRTRAELDRHVQLWLETPIADEGLYTVDSRTPAPKTPIGYLLSLEGADSLITIGHLEKSYNDGLRALGPAHYGPGVYAHGTDAGGPLPARGKGLLIEMDRLGMILDVTHLCDQNFWEALEIFHGPIWASHQNCRTLAPWNRQFADDQIRAVIERGGVLGMAFDAIMMVPGWKHLRSKPQDYQLKISRIVDHIDHVCQLAGNTRHVGIGTDLDGGYGTEQMPLDMDSIADLQSIPQLLRNRGYTEEDIEGIMWRNFIDFLRKVLK
jgi:membrane dipeptidase